MVTHQGKAYVPMKPVVTGMGLSWARQSEKIKNSTRYTRTCIPCKTAGGVQDMDCLPLDELNGWLYSVNPDKVREDIQNMVIMYQKETTQAIHDYWTKGNAVNPRMAPKGFFETQDKEFKALKSIAKQKGLRGTDSVRFATEKMKGKYGDPEGLFELSHIPPGPNEICLDFLDRLDLLLEEHPELNHKTKGEIAFNLREVRQVLLGTTDSELVEDLPILKVELMKSGRFIENNKTVRSQHTKKLTRCWLITRLSD